MLGELFDPHADLLIQQRLRPHWSQAGAIVFITFRTFDSLPAALIERWDREKIGWLARRGHGGGGSWKLRLPTLPSEEREAFLKHFNRSRETSLDECLGGCPLRRQDLAQIVANALLHFDGVRYRMGDFVVMPNHVHLLAAFPSADAMKKQIASWLHYTAYRIHQILGQKGHFWQQEPFDHLVRSPEQYDYLRQYIAENPQKARLREGEYLYRRLP